MLKCHGLQLLDNNLKITYASSTKPIQGSRKFNYDFTAQSNGYIIISYSNTYKTEAFIYNVINNNNNNIDFSSLKIGFTGDSICAGDGYNGGYAKCLNELYGLKYQNIAVSGGRIVTSNYFTISNSIPNFDNDIEAICIEGGINDTSENGSPLGELTQTYTDAINQSTFYGALEKMFRDCFNLFPNIPIFYVISHNSNNAYYRTFGDNLKFEDYIAAIKKTCEKYGVYVIDLFHDSHFCTGISNSLKERYTANGDGLHPNREGYIKFYVPFLKDYIKNILLSD